MKKTTPSEQITAILDSGCYDYGIDQMEIASKVGFEKLNQEISRLRSLSSFSKELVLYSKVLEIEELLKKFPVDAKRKKYDDLIKGGYKTIFRMTDPTSKFFNLLSNNEKIFETYKLWIIELRKDLLLNSESDAIVFTEWLIDTTYRKSSMEVFLYHAINNYKLIKDEVPNKMTEKELEDWLKERSKVPRYDPTIFGKRTLYLGKKDFEYKIYGRYSKRTRQPCAHSEWKIRWSKDYKIFSELGIKKKNSSHFQALEKLTKLGFPRKWESFTDNRIKQAEINKELVGKHFSDCEHSEQLFQNMTNKWRRKKRLTEKEKWYVHLLYQQCLSKFKIETTAEFVQFWHNNRELNIEAKDKNPALHYREFLIGIDLQTR